MACRPGWSGRPVAAAAGAATPAAALSWSILTILHADADFDIIARVVGVPAQRADT